MAKKQGFSKIIQIIDKILEGVVWVNKDAKLVSLKQALHQANPDGSAKNIENLPIEDLIGAFTCIQIRRELFNENATSYKKEKLVERIKDLIFEEAKIELEKQNIDTDGVNGEKTAVA